MSVLSYLGSTIDLVKAASALPADFRSQPAVRGWLESMSLPLSQIIAQAATDIEGPPAVEAVGLETRLDEALAAAGLTADEAVAAHAVLGMIDSRVTSRPVAEAAVPRAGEAWWIPLVVEMVRVAIEAVRNRRKQEA